MYSILTGLGASIGLWLLIRRDVSDEPLHWLIAGSLTLLGGLIGARTGYVATHLSFYATNPSDILAFWWGGLTAWGAFTGGLLAAGLTAVILRTKLLETFDRLSVLLPPMVITGWLAAWSAGTAYGQILESSTWWGMMTRDISGAQALRVPLQPAAALSYIIILLAAGILVKHSATGTRFGFTGLIFAVHTLFFSMMRADPAQRFLGLRLDTLTSISYSLLFIILLAWIWLRQRKKRIK